MIAGKRTMIVVGLAALAALALLASACGGAGGMFGMDETHRQMHGGGSREPQTPVVADAAKVTVEIRDYDYFPRELTVQAGTTVDWINRDTVPHDAKDDAGDWGTGMLQQDDSATLTFDSPGTYEYVCTIHPNMKGALTVT